MNIKNVKEAMSELKSIRDTLRSTQNDPDIDMLEPLMERSVELNKFVKGRVESVRKLKSELMVKEV